MEAAEDRLDRRLLNTSELNVMIGTLEHAANDSGICKELFEHHDEKPTNSFLYSLVMDTYSFGYTSSAFSAFSRSFSSSLYSILVRDVTPAGRRNVAIISSV